MALVSPGVQVSVVNESFYTPAAPGTVPLIIVASATNKTNSSGTGIAAGTLAANAGKVYLISSQKELANTFGDPLFYTDANNNPINGGEQNEYGLQAAYSFLGVSNNAYVLRADIDLASITASSTPTAGDPVDGSYWFDTLNSLYGVFEWNGGSAATTGGQTFTNKVPTVITDTTKVVNYAGGDYTPKGSVGAIGDYALVAVTTVNRLWYKNSNGTWVEVGSPEWKASNPFVVGASNPTGILTGRTMYFDPIGDSALTYSITTTGTTVASLVTQINNNATLAAAGITAGQIGSALALYYNGTAGDNIVIYGDIDLTNALGITQQTYYIPSLAIQPHTSVPDWKSNTATPRPTGSVWVKTTTPNLGANWDVKTYSASTMTWSKVSAPIYDTNQAALYNLDSAGGGANLTTSSIYIQDNVTESANKLATFKLFKRVATGATTITSAKITASTFAAGLHSFTASETVVGSATLSTKTVSFVATGATSDADLIASAINAAGFTNVTASVDSQNRVVISHKTGGDIRFVDTNGALFSIFTPYDVTVPTSTTNFYYAPGTDITTNPKEFIATLWKQLTYTASATEPTTTPATGTLWYSSVVDEVDIMYHNGTTWVGYQDATAFPTTNPTGPIVSASQPTQQTDGSALVDNDLWISTADLENYPMIYRYNGITGKWVLLDKTDQTTDNGVLFADARYNVAGADSNQPGAIADLLASNYLDPDAPDPALYPKGMILWNLRRSGFNVKRFVQNYIDVNGVNIRQNNESMANYYPHRWVTESANNADGSGSFGHKAQRKVVVQSLQATINSNQDIRDTESRLFNLIACPGYPELINEMVTLNYDRGTTAFVIGDSPFRLTPDSTSLGNWANNVYQALEDGTTGLVSNDEYLGVYYPSGYTSDNFGNNIVVPPSHMVLRTFALNDQVAYPWFAPAGTRRGGVTNASAVGYLNSSNEFVSVALNVGQRDTLYQANVNPIAYLNGAGLVVYGQKTRARSASALDRVNVARLVVYLRGQLDTLGKPYIYEPNDTITRNEIKAQVESLMVELVGLRAIYDYLVVCDETNNTPSRIDRNELYVDIAIEPVKAIEFIYIPLRIKTTGAIASA